MSSEFLDMEMIKVLGQKEKKTWETYNHMRIEEENIDKGKTWYRFLGGVREGSYSTLLNWHWFVLR